ncbi:hypothetical protein [Mesorhizobium japonicum]|nr:hypothetical protein [Mesorhizobium japonicum]
MSAIDYAELAKSLETGATLIKEAATEFGSAATQAAQIDKLTADNATLTSQLQTAQTDLAASQAQVADLVAKSNANNDALAAVLAPPAPPQQ